MRQLFNLRALKKTTFRLHPSFLPRNTKRVGNSEQECRAKARRAQIGEFQRQRESEQLPRPSLLGEQNAGLEQTRTEVIWTEYRQVDGTEHPARFRTYEAYIRQISFCEDAPLSIARTE